MCFTKQLKIAVNFVNFNIVVVTFTWWTWRELYGFLIVSFPCLIWYKGREVVKRSEKYVSCTYISLLGRYNVTCSSVECWKTTDLTDTCLKNRVLWIHNKWFMESWFGVIVGCAAEPLQTKKKLHLAIVTRIRTYQDDRNIKFLNTEWHVQK